MIKNTITENEQWAVQRLLNAQEADFKLLNSEEPCVIEAELIRCLMLGLPIAPHGQPVKLSGMGVRIKHAIIKGRLNLEHGSLSDGGHMPCLSLESCRITEGINLKSARIRRLCLKDSQISEMMADHIHISGLLDIRGIRSCPLSGKEGTGKSMQWRCHLSLCAAHIEDGIEAGGAHLVAPPSDKHYAKYSKRAAYALDLPEAKINGDIRLFPNFTACGGVNINGATIHGSLHAHGALFTSAQLYGLDACGAHIYGNLSLDSRNVSPEERRTARHEGTFRAGSERFRCEGQLRLHNVVIEEDLRLHGAKIYGVGGCIAAEHMTVNGDVCFCASDLGLGDRIDDGDFDIAFEPAVIPFECDKRIDIRGAKISGDLNFRGAILKDKLDVSIGRIGGHLLFSPLRYDERGDSGRGTDLQARFICGNTIKLSSAHVAGNLYFTGAQINGEIVAYGLGIEGYADFSPFVPRDESQAPFPFESNKKIILDSATIAQKMDMSGAQLQKEFIAPNITVGGKLLLCAFAPENRPACFIWFEAHQRVTLSGADVKGDMDLTGARLHQGLRFRGGKVGSALIFDIYDPPSETPIKAADRVSIDLFNAHANILSDLHITFGHSGSYSLRPAYQPSYFLRLEGFTYGRFPHHADDESLGREEKNRRQALKNRLALQLGEAPQPKGFEFREIDPEAQRKKRLEWLTLQYRGVSKGKNVRTAVRKPERHNYNPDPYNTLYKYYKRMGAQSLADDVLFLKLKIERKTGDWVRRLLFWPFELYFGYGLKPVRATVILLAYTALIFPLINFDSTAKIVATAPMCAYVFSTCTPQSISHHVMTIQSYAVDTIETIAPNTAFPANSAPQEQVYAGRPLLRVLLSFVWWSLTWLALLGWSGFLRRNLEP